MMNFYVSIFNFDLTELRLKCRNQFEMTLTDGLGKNEIFANFVQFNNNPSTMLT